MGGGVIGFVLLAGLVIYLIAMFGMRERTFEEVIAEQRRYEAETKAKGKAEKKDKKKYRKGKGKGDKQASHGSGQRDEKTDKTDHSAAIEELQKMVELELEPEIIDPVEQPRPEKEKKKKKEKKSILANREEKSYIQDGSGPDLFHSQSLPKDEVELKHEKEHEAMPSPMELEVVAPARKEKKRDREVRKEPVVQQEIIVQEELQMEEVIPVRSEPRKPKKNRPSPEYGAGGMYIYTVRDPS